MMNTKRALNTFVIGKKESGIYTIGVYIEYRGWKKFTVNFREIVILNVNELNYNTILNLRIDEVFIVGQDV